MKQRGEPVSIALNIGPTVSKNGSNSRNVNKPWLVGLSLFINC